MISKFPICWFLGLWNKSLSYTITDLPTYSSFLRSVRPSVFFAILSIFLPFCICFFTLFFFVTLFPKMMIESTTHRMILWSLSVCLSTTPLYSSYALFVIYGFHHLRFSPSTLLWMYFFSFSFYSILFHCSSLFFVFFISYHIISCHVI